MRLLTAAILSTIAVASARGVELPVGTEIQIRLQTAVGSTKSKQGDAVRAVVIMPVLWEQDVAIASGSTLTGKVKAAQPAKDTNRAALELEFGDLTRRGEQKR